MGVIYSIPLCSRNKEGDGANDAGEPNNNQPMPSLQHSIHPGMVVSVQPGPTSIANPTATVGTENLKDEEGEEDEQPERREERYSSSLDSSRGEEEEDGSSAAGRETTPTSDSGLEQSSSDELELGAAALGKHGAAPGNPGTNKQLQQLQEQERPFSAAGENRDEPPPLLLSADEEEDDGMVRIPLENHDTCEDDDDDDDDPADDPVERPPEPTVPDERVDTSSSSSSDERSSPQRRPPPVPKPGTIRRTGANDTTSAITNILSEIVGDRPYEQHEKETADSGFGGGMLMEREGGREVAR